VSAVVEVREPSVRYMGSLQPQQIEHFGLLASALDGPARLRDLILTLAVQGRLVAQDVHDEPASQLLQRVQAAKRELLASGCIGRDKPLEPVNDDDTGYVLPAGWAWCRLGDLAWPQAGFAFKSAGFNEVGQGLPLIRIRDVGSNAEPTTFFSGEHRTEFLVNHGDWLISMDGEFRVRRWHSTTALLNQRVTRLVFASTEVRAEFIADSLQRQLLALQGTKAYTTVDHLSGRQIAEAVIALPPAREQARIVARVDELMRLCDALEDKGRLEAEQHARLLSALLGMLTDSATPEELAANWQRVAGHFDLLLDRPEAVDVVEEAVLELAVRGALSSAKQSAVAEDFCSVDGPGYALPMSWRWAQLGQLVDGMGSGWSPACDEGQRIEPSRWAVLRTTAVQRMRYEPTEHKATPINLKPRPEIEVRAGDILITRAGPTNRVGVSCWVKDTPSRLMLSDKIVRFRLRGDDMLPEFLVLCLNAGWTKTRLEAAKTGMAASQVNVSQADLKLLPIPVCAVEEQMLIVARVTELRSLCTTLRQRLQAQQATQSRLAEALVEQALAG
jgi:type I restriction enzyme S subunit